MPNEKDVPDEKVFGEFMFIGEAKHDFSNLFDELLFDAGMVQVKKTLGILYNRIKSVEAFVEDKADYVEKMQMSLDDVRAVLRHLSVDENVLSPNMKDMIRLGHEKCNELYDFLDSLLS